MLFLQISKHSIESCPMHNEIVSKVFKDSMAKMDQLLKKYGVKMVGGWAAMVEHTFAAVYEAPTMDALLKLASEPEMMKFNEYNMTELIPVMTLEESIKMMK